MTQEALQERIIAGEEFLTLRERLLPSRWLKLLKQDFNDLVRFRHVLRNFVVTELKTRYQRSFLGFFWTMLNPVLMMTVLALVFSQIMNQRLSDYALYLFSGLIPWQFFSYSVNTGSRCLIASEFLIKKIEIPKFLFPINCVLVAAVNMIFEIGALFILFKFLGARVHVQLVLLPIGIIFLSAFSLGLAMVSMTLVSRYRDFEHIIGVLLQALYFMSPILYPREFMSKYPAIVTLNPLSYLLEFFQDAFCLGVWPPPHTWLAAFAIAVLSLSSGYSLYKRHEASYVFWL